MVLSKKKNGFWTFEECLKESAKYQTISDWVRSSGSSYQAAKLNDDWFKKCTSHMIVLWEKKWIQSTILQDAKQYKTPQDWVRNSNGAYGAALRLKILRQATAHMKKNPRWFGVSNIHQILKSYDLVYQDEKTFDDCRDKRKLPFDFYLPVFNLLIEHHGTQHQRGRQGVGASEIQRRDTIKRNFAEAYGIHYLEIKEWVTKDFDDVKDAVTSKLYKIQPELVLACRDLTEVELENSLVAYKFDINTLKEIALQFSSRAEFKRGNEPAYNFACRHKLIDQVCGHMMTKKSAQSKSLTKWTKEKVIQSALKFTTAREWAKNEGSAYNSARKNNWLDEASAHFLGRVSE